MTKPWTAQRIDLGLTLGLAAMGLAFGAGGLRLSLGSLQKPGAGLFPVLASLCLLALVAVRLPDILKARASAPGGEGLLNRKLLVILLALLAYVLALPWLGYYVATFLLIAGVARLMGAASRRGPVIMGLVTVLLIYLLFEFWLLIPLPKGFGG